MSTPQKIADQVQRLNKGGQDAIATAWELAVTGALTNTFEVAIEPPLGTKTLVDFRIFAKSINWAAIGDIVSIFDSGMYEESGFRAIEKLVWPTVERHKLVRHRFNLWLEADVVGTGSKKRIKLPALQRTTIMPPLESFLVAVANEPTASRSKDLRAFGGFHIRYDPNQYSGDWSGTRIDATYGIAANPLMNALKRKAKQLRDTNSIEPRIIICCDGGSHSLRAQRNAAWATPTTDEVIKDFLRQSTAISGVVVVIVDGSPIRAVLDARSRRLYRIAAMLGNQATMVAASALELLAETLEDNLPSVVRSPTSFPRPWAFTPDYNYFRFWDFNRTTAQSIQVPMRALLDLLAGRIEHTEFIRRYVSPVVEQVPEHNLFARWLDSGRLLKEIRVIKTADHDDDWVEICCGEPDAALIPFR